MSERETYVQSNPASFQADDKHLGLSRRGFKAGYSFVTLLNVHRAIEAVPWKAFALQYDLYQVQEGCELRENNRAEARILVSQSAYCTVRGQRQSKQAQCLRRCCTKASSFVEDRKSFLRRVTVGAGASLASPAPSLLFCLERMISKRSLSCRYFSKVECI